MNVYWEALQHRLRDSTVINTIRAPLHRYLRGPAMSRLLRRFGIDPYRYWLLIDLFGELTDRHEMGGHLGRDGISLNMVAGVYFLLTAFLAGVQVLLAAPVHAYFAVFMGLTAFLLLTVLLSETANSLVNPVEALVLAHQPIDGATYTAAKLTHLLIVLGYVVSAVNLLPALAGLLLSGAHWSYPLFHFFSACILGLVIALFCCALFGLLIRFVPAARLKTIGQIAEASPLLLIVVAGQARRIFQALHVPFDLPADPVTLRVIAIAIFLVAVLSVVYGLRALSADYLVRVAAVMHGASHAPASPSRRTPLAAAITRLAGGHSGSQPARAGFEYVRRMMFRDWQFRRQMIPMIPAAVMPLLAIFGGSRATPFSGRFTPVYFLPHALGAMLFLVCTILPHGSDYKGSWIFLTVPGGAFHGFVRGVYALLWTAAILIPNLIALGFLAWNWGPADALLFVAFSLAIASVYLALELRLVEGVPFGKPVDTSRGMVLMPLMMAGGMVIAVMVALQHYLLFHSRPLVLAVTLLAAAAAWFLTRASLDTFEVSIRYHLGLVSRESAMLYQEIDG
jgi:type IV secretory pathway TrbD component